MQDLADRLLEPERLTTLLSSLAGRRAEWRPASTGALPLAHHLKLSREKAHAAQSGRNRPHGLSRSLVPERVGPFRWCEQGLVPLDSPARGCGATGLKSPPDFATGLRATSSLN